MDLVDNLLKLPPYRLSPDMGRDLLRSAVQQELLYHCAQCPLFDRWFRKQGGDPAQTIDDLAALPFLPVSIFKKGLPLQSVRKESIVRVIHSSATSSQVPSRIPLDTVTRNRQMRALAVLLGDLVGNVRRPFVVLDAPSGPVDGEELSARVAGLRGYLIMASAVKYAFPAGEAGQTVGPERLTGLLENSMIQGVPVCLIGYTHVLYCRVVVPLLERGMRLELPARSVIMHFGGWKRLEEQAVDRERFNADVWRVFTGDRLELRDIYGFTEQLGVIYPDDGCGVRLAPAFSEVLVRDPLTFELAPDGTTGLLQFITPLPHSYPGISLLLEDLGRIVSRDAEVNGRYGTRFEVLGRAKGSELRGCGDTLSDAQPKIGV